MAHRGLSDGWSLVEPGFKGLTYDNITGLTDYGKETILGVVKAQFCQQTDDCTAINDDMPSIAISIKDRFFDTRYCSNCSHETVCGRTQLIKQVKSQGIEVNDRCDQWLTKEG